MYWKDWEEILLKRFSAKFEKYALKFLAASLTSKLGDLSVSRQLILKKEHSNFRPKDLISSIIL